MTKTISDLKVGDEVWFTDTANGRGRIETGTVYKIGSKLITVVQDRHQIVFRVETMRENDNYQHNKLILDLQDYEETQEIYKIVRLINRGNSVPKSLQDAKDAAKLLNIDIGE